MLHSSPRHTVSCHRQRQSKILAFPRRLVDTAGYVPPDAALVVKQGRWANVVENYKFTCYLPIIPKKLRPLKKGQRSKLQKPVHS